MNYGAALAWGVIILSAGASLGYLLAGDPRRALYWAAAVALNLSVTWR